ncbi:MAG: ATP-binding protein [Spirochaetia bacterium]|jgi:nitrogen fixation/metabolism regulation signal transduction histidine kinase|nr:ATP-binding protein [Spirochaetia bacterium]
MKYINKLLAFIIFTFILTLTVSSEEVVRISFVVSETLIEHADKESTLAVLNSYYINTESMILPYLELECTQCLIMKPLSFPCHIRSRKMILQYYIKYDRIFRMTTGFGKNRAKLKTKILLLIFLILLIQITIISSLSLFIFNRQISRTAEIELTRELNSTKLSLEGLKNRLYNRIHLLRYTLESMKESELNRLRLFDIISTHFSSIKADRAVLLNEEGTTIFSLHREGSIYPVEKELNLGDFRFVVNKIVLSRESKSGLYLVSGTKIYHNSGKRFYLFFINNLDNNFANNLFKETGINFALFSGDSIFSTVVPEFKLPTGSITKTTPIWISSIPYLAKIETISTDIPEGVTLVVLRSALQDNLYKRQLTSIFLASFFITLIVSLGYAVGITNRILVPFYELNSWMSKYLETGTLEELTIERKDEIGFLTRTSRTIVQKLISEENIIRKQLDEISFLNKYNTEIMNNLKAGVLMVEYNGSISFYNNFFESLLELKGTDIKGQYIENIFNEYFIPEGDWPDYPSIDLTRDHEYPVRLKSGIPEELKFIVKISPLPESGDSQKTLILMGDITATERLWNKIMVTEKISSMGLLSAGMAHEINNPLGSILSHISYLKTVEKDEEKIDSIKWIESETRRIGDIVTRVLTFSRESESKSEPSNINSIIEEVIDISKFSIKNRKIEIKNKLWNKESLISTIAKDEFKQIFLNLFLNATQAIRESGIVTIETKRDMNNILIIISDSGHGIKAEDLKNIFNPFFSTKALTNTSGLGLSITYSIIQKAGGDIEIASIPEEGTIVKVKLPKLKIREHNDEYPNS